MLRVFIKALVAILLPLLAASPVAAGAWNQRAGEGQVISTSSWTHAGKIFDDDHTAIPLRGFTKTETRLYIEHGVTDWLTLVGNTGLQTLNFRDEDSRFDFDGLDDIEFGAQFKVFTQKNLATSFRLSYIFDSALDNQAIDILRGGDQIELRALIGQSRETLVGDFFYDAQFALRSEALKDLDGMQGALTLGYKPTNRWLGMVQSFANFSNNQEIDGFRVPAQLKLNTQVSVGHQYSPGRYLQIGVGQTFLGQNIVKERSVFMGLWTEY